VEDKQVALEKAAREKAAREKAARGKAKAAQEQTALEQGTVTTEQDDDNGNQKPGAPRKRRRSVAHVPGSFLRVITNGSSSVGAERSCRRKHG
jgi:type II secretory pathway pseudopilin PulG